MPLRIRFPKSPLRGRDKGPIPHRTIGRYFFYVTAVLLAVLAGFIGYSYVKYSRIADRKLTLGPFPDTSVLFAAPENLSVGDPASIPVIADRLKESGYGEDAKQNSVGWYHRRADAIEIFPGSQSKSDAEPAVLRFRDGKLSGIVALSDNSTRTSYALEPAVLSTMFDKDRNKRRLVRYEDIPPILVQAVVSVEDKRFFKHNGLDILRLTKAMIVDLKSGQRREGGSTLTQQLAKMLWLTTEKTFDRKFHEILITIHLERKLTKEKIFEYYANQVPLGRRGSFNMVGFGEASQGIFGKDMRQLTLPEAATLAGLGQIPSARNPFRWPERATARRNVVLKLMLDNGYISESQYRDAVATPLVVTQKGLESTDAPYFVDRVNDILSDRFGDKDFLQSGSRIYTTIDLDLQRDAAAAVAEGTKEIDAILAKRTPGQPIDTPQVALICLDPHTGEVKALVGGRNYGLSQLDHSVAKRPSGSVFKPFVYAAALNTGLWTSSNPPMTTSSVVDDKPKTFMWNGEEYSPSDFHKNAWAGQVTLRTAFAKSLNVPAIEVAEQAGYRNVADLAHKAGLADVRPTPSMALGAYSVTPLDMAGAFTIFGNGGVMVKPRMISHIVDKNGKEWTSEAETSRVLDPRVNFLVVSMMQDVLRWGTGAGVARRGFTLPAAAKTGTSHDAWFGGFTSKLLCIVWVGLDDYKDIKMEGATAAMPIWAAFMKRAHMHPAYRDVKNFSIPDGIVTAQIDNGTGQLATSACPQNVLRTEYYLSGTAPTQFCPLHVGGTEITTWQDNLPNVPPGGLPAPISQLAPPVSPTSTPAVPPADAAEAATADASSKDRKAKKNLLDKLKTIFH